ncbi:hypothetical protein PCI56_12575 [Plesiomonas shigelloides subsp. oncorhynchi]|nr:hypothetical protein [Plesiomonas shigelloides]
MVLDVSEATALAKATAAERAIADEFRQAIWIQLLVGLALALLGMLGIGWPRAPLPNRSIKWWRCCGACPLRAAISPSGWIFAVKMKPVNWRGKLIS